MSENFSMKVGGCKFIKEVIVRHGYIVDAIGFVVADPCGSETNMFGGDGGNESKVSNNDLLKNQFNQTFKLT